MSQKAVKTKRSKSYYVMSTAGEAEVDEDQLAEWAEDEGGTCDRDDPSGKDVRKE